MPPLPNRPSGTKPALTMSALARPAQMQPHHPGCRRQRDRPRGRAGAARARARPRRRRHRRRLRRALAGAEAAAPQVLVTDIRMPPSFQREGIDAAKELRKRHPGTGVVVLSQYDDPEYAISLLADGAAGLRLPAQGPGRARATSSPGRCARSRPAARCSTPRSSRRWCSRSPTTAASPRPTRSCCTRSPRAGRSRRSPPRSSTTPAAVADVGREAVPQAVARARARGDRRRAEAAAHAARRRSSTARSRARR